MIFPIHFFPIQTYFRFFLFFCYVLLLFFKNFPKIFFFMRHLSFNSFAINVFYGVLLFSLFLNIFYFSFYCPANTHRGVNYWQYQYQVCNIQVEYPSQLGHWKNVFVYIHCSEILFSTIQKEFICKCERGRICQEQ